MNTDTKKEHGIAPDDGWDTIHAYTRAQALADGQQIEVNRELANEAGLRVPVFLTDTVYNTYVKVPDGVTAQDEPGRLWDILWMTRFAILKAHNKNTNRLPVALYVRNSNDGPTLVKLAAMCGPLDIDKSEPAITIMLPEED